jgi:hypothetical protein
VHIHQLRKISVHRIFLNIYSDAKLIFLSLFVPSMITAITCQTHPPALTSRCLLASCLPLKPLGKCLEPITSVCPHFPRWISSASCTLLRWDFECAFIGQRTPHTLRNSPFLQICTTDSHRFKPELLLIDPKWIRNVQGLIAVACLRPEKNVDARSSLG